ncbi:MAG: hypothetical protein EXR17_02370 [Flavobacteriaceae bacterium]|nr:hypothetical protein [Flavobacteriaceae bacterium]
MVACEKDKNTISFLPKIDFLGIYQIGSGFGYDSIVRIDVKYGDGDGDIGLDSNYNFYPFGIKDPAYFNLLIYYQHKKGGIWTYPINPLLIPPDTLVLHQRIPVITPSGRSKAIQGEISIALPARPFSYRGDSVRYRIQLIDRALHRSDIILTQSIWLEHP